MGDREDSPEFSVPVSAISFLNADEKIKIVGSSDEESSMPVESGSDSDNKHSAMEAPKEEEEKKSGESDNGDSDGDQEDDEEPSSSGTQLFAVEAVKRMRGSKPNREFFIKWHGYPESENTWEPECGVLHLEIVQQYLEESESKKKEKEAKAFREAKRRKEEAERRHAEEKAARKRAKEDAARKEEKRRLKAEAKKSRRSSDDEAVGEESDAQVSKLDHGEKKDSARSDSEERARLARKKAKREERERLRVEEEKKRKSDKHTEENVKSGIKDNDEDAVDKEVDLTEKDVTKRKDKSLNEDEAEKAARKKAKREEEQRQRDEIERRLKREAARDREEKERLQKMTPKEIAQLEQSLQSKRPEKKVSKEADVERSEKPATSSSFPSKVKDNTVAVAEEKSSIKATEKDKPTKKKNDATALFFGKKTETEIKKPEVKKSAPIRKEAEAAVKEQQKSAKQENKQTKPAEKQSRSSSNEIDDKESKEKKETKAEKREKEASRAASVEIDEKDSALKSQNTGRKTDMETKTERRSSSVEFDGTPVKGKKTHQLEAEEKRSSSIEFREMDAKPEKEVVKPAKRKSRSSSVEFDAKDPGKDLFAGRQDDALTPVEHSSPAPAEINRDRDCSPEITVPPRYSYTVPTRDETSSESEGDGSEDGSGAEEGDGEAQFEVRKILEDRWSDSEESQVYFVQWVGYTSEDDTWEPEENLRHLDIFKEYQEKKAEKAKKREEKRKERAKAVLPKDVYTPSSPSSDEEEEQKRKKAVERKPKRPEPAKTAPHAATGRPAKSSRKLTHMDKVFGVQEDDLADEEQARKNAVFSKSYRLTEKSQFQRPLDDGPSLTGNIAPVKYENIVKDLGTGLKIPKRTEQKPAEPRTSVSDKVIEAPPVQYLSEADGIFDSLAPQDRKYFKLVFDTSPALPAPRDPKPIMTYVPKDLPKLAYYVKPDRFDGLFNRMMFLRKRPDHTSQYDPPLVTGPHSMIETSSANRNVIQQSRSGSSNIANYCEYFRRHLWPKQLEEEKRNENYVSREIELFLKFQAKNPSVEEYVAKRDGVRLGAPQRRAVKRVQRPVRRH